MAEDPVIAQKGPYQVELKEGQAYFFCRCGRSEKQPFCDGSHKGTGLEPQSFTVDAPGTYNLVRLQILRRSPLLRRHAQYAVSRRSE